MRRRDLVKSLVGVAVAWPLAAMAQKIPPRRAIGFLHIGAAKSFDGIVAACRAGLAEFGYVEHQDYDIEFRWAEGRYERLRPMAEDLVSRKVAVIITGGGEPPAFAAKEATRTIPIVFNIGRDPVEVGLVSSLSRPGGNITGVNILTSELATKRVALLHDLLPNVSAIAYVVNPNFPPTEVNVKQVKEAIRLLGLDVVLFKASNESEIDAAFQAIRRQGLQALLVGDDPFFNSRRGQFVALAARQGVPAIYEQREFALGGGLMSYGTSLTDSYREIGKYAARILRGESPAALPVIQLAKFQLVINITAAKALGIIVPPMLLARADEVIE